MHFCALHVFHPLLNHKRTHKLLQRIYLRSFQLAGQRWTAGGTVARTLGTLPDHSVGADDKLWFGIPLVVGNVVVCLEPDPLLSFSQKAVIAGLSLSELHYWGGKGNVWRQAKTLSISGHFGPANSDITECDLMLPLFILKNPSSLTLDSWKVVITYSWIILLFGNCYSGAVGVEEKHVFESVEKLTYIVCDILLLAPSRQHDNNRSQTFREPQKASSQL